jgi:hypothetical protein
MLAVGVFCLTLAPLVPWYVLPRLELAPQNIDVSNVTTGTGSYFDGTGLKGPVPLTITSRLVGDVQAGAANGVAVWDLSTQVDNPDTVKFHDPRLSMSWLVERLVFDRHTNEPVHCCGETPRHEGNAYLKFPFDVGKGTYQYWNPFVRKAFPVTYTGDVTVEGHTLYRFEGKVPPTASGSLDLPGSLIGLPDQPGMVHAETYYHDDGETILVDPLSGTPVSTTQHPVTTLRLPGGDKDLLTLSSFTIAPTPDIVHATLAGVLSGDKSLQLIKTGVPTTFLALGSFLVLLAIAELVRAHRIPRHREQPHLVEVASS